MDTTVEATCKSVQEPRVDGTESEALFFCGVLDFLDVVEEPAELASGEVGGER